MLYLSLILTLLTALACESKQDSRRGNPLESKFAGQYAMLVKVTVDQELPVIGNARSETLTVKRFSVSGVDGTLVAEEQVCRIDVIAEGPAQPSFSNDLISRFPTITSPLSIEKGEEGWRWHRERSGIVLGAELENHLNDELPTESSDPRLVDHDSDGNHGVTIPIQGILEGELHAVLRYADELSGTWSGISSDEWIGTAIDYTEQSVIASTHEILMTQFPSQQVNDPTLNAVIVIPLEVEKADCTLVESTLVERGLIPVREEDERDRNEDAPFGYLCDGQAASVYDEQLLERTNCGGDDPFVLPPARIELEPKTVSPYEAERCGAIDDTRSDEALLKCAEFEFWHAFSDGRLIPRQEALEYISNSLSLLEERVLPERLNPDLGRLYMLRGMFYMAIGLENGVSDYLIDSEAYSSLDFDRVEELDDENFAVIAFDLTLQMTLAGLAGEHERAAEIARNGLDYVLGLGDPDVVEDKNVGAVLGLSGTTMTWPLNTGIPQKTLEALEAVDCPHNIEFCERNTVHAPYARPGLEYHKAEVYARLNMREAYQAQLEIVAQQPGYEDWPWREVVEIQRKEPSRLLNKYLSYGEDEYAQSYATMSSGCVMCHGR